MIVRKPTRCAQVDAATRSSGQRRRQPINAGITFRPYASIVPSWPRPSGDVPLVDASGLEAQQPRGSRAGRDIRTLAQATDTTTPSGTSHRDAIPSKHGCVDLALAVHRASRIACVRAARITSSLPSHLAE